MSDPVKLQTYNFGREAVDSDGNHYTLANPGHSWGNEYTRDDDPDKDHNYLTTETDGSGNITEGCKDWPW